MTATLYERKEAAVKSLAAWYEEERLREVLTVVPERQKVIERRGPPTSMFGVYADSPEYARMYQRQRRERIRKETGRDR
jgi:hypothetical protein